MSLHDVTITITTQDTNFVSGTPGPSQIRVAILDFTGTPVGAAVIASGSPLQAVFTNIADGSYTMTATTLDANGNAIPAADVNHNQITATITAPLVVSDPPVTLQVAVGFTVAISAAAVAQPSSTIGGDGPTLP